MNRAGRIRALILDYDGVIVDSEGIHLAATNTALRDHGVAIDARSWALECLGHPSPSIVRRMLPDVSPDEVDRLVAAGRRAYAEILEREPLESRPGIAHLVREAHGRGVLVAVASSGPTRPIEQSLDALGLGQYMQSVTGVEAVARPKPAPDAYLQALSSLGVSASAAVALEDSPPGIRSAMGAGVLCLAFPNAFTRLLDLSAADAVVEELDAATIRAVLDHPDQLRTPPTEPSPAP